MTNKKHEALIFANDRPSEIGDDLYQWASDAEDMIRRQHARIVELEKENSYLNDACAELEARIFATNPAAQGVLVIDTCDEGGHKYAKLPDHPMRQGIPRCPHCMAIGLDRARSELAAKVKQGK